MLQSHLRILRCCQAVAVVLLMKSAGSAQEAPAWDDPPRDHPTIKAGPSVEKPGPPQWRGGWADRRPNPGPAPDVTLPAIRSGLVFVEGKFLPPPYFVRSEGDQLLINDQPVLAEISPDYPENRFRMHRRQAQMAMQLQLVAASLDAGNVILAFNGEPLVVLSRSSAGYHLLAEMTGRQEADRTIATRELPAGFSHDLFHDWLDSYEATPELSSYALPIIEQVRNAEADSLRAIAAVRRTDTFLYLVTVFGMVISVAATGHLLSAKPPTARDAQDDPEMVKMVSRSLGLVVILSSLDLFWTIMASQSGKMIELNPIGSQLLHDPLQLIAVKAVVICGSVGLLYFLRHHRQAQTAAWWACLICTLLTFRWLTFNSMFV